MPEPADHHPPNGFKRGLAWSVGNIILGGLLIGGALLRETPLFWRNSGGYPEPLRELVFYLFYPGVLVNFIVVAVISWLAYRGLGNGSHGSRWSGILFYACLVQWVILSTVLIIAWWNNTYNILHGLPLHHHPAI